MAGDEAIDGVEEVGWPVRWVDVSGVVVIVVVIVIVIVIVAAAGGRHEQGERQGRAEEPGDASVVLSGAQVSG